MVDHYFRHAKGRLAEKLEQLTRRHVRDYCLAEEAEAEFVAEWQGLGQYLAEHGGLEEAVRQAHELLNPLETLRPHDSSLNRAAAQLTSIMRTASGPPLARPQP